MRAQPHQVRLDARNLVQQHAQQLRAFGNLQPQQLLHRQAVGQIVGHRRQVVDAVGQRHHLLVELGLAGLLDASVQVADVGRQRDDDLAVQFQHHAQHAVRRWVLRSHVEHHRVLSRARVAVALRVLDDVFDAGSNPVWSCKRCHSVFAFNLNLVPCASYLLYR